MQSIRTKLYAQPGTAEGNPGNRMAACELGIPTVVDRVIQQAIAQKLQSIWEPLFFRQQLWLPSETERQQAIQKVKEYVEEGYRYAVSVDLSKYFDTLNHELLMNLLHKTDTGYAYCALVKSI